MIKNREKCQDCLFPEQETLITKILKERTKTCRTCKYLIAKVCVECGKEHGWCISHRTPVNDFDFKHRCGNHAMLLL